MTTDRERVDSSESIVQDSSIMTMIQRGGYREGAGRKSAFPGKVIEAPFAMDFTPKGRKALERLTTRTGLSRNDVIAHLAKRYAARLKFTKEGVEFPGKAQNVLAIRVPEDVGARLHAARERTGKSYSDIGEALVLWHGPKEDRWPVHPGDRPRRRRSRR